MAGGIYKVHGRGCPAFKNAKRNDSCICRRPTWQAHVRGRVKGDPPLRKHFKTRGEAVAWRDEMGDAVRNGAVSTSRRSDRNLTVGDAAAKLISGMRDGTVVDNRQQRFKPSTIRGYERTLTKRLPVWFSRMKVRDVTRGDVREVVAEWRRAGHETKDGPQPLSASTVQNRTDALRTLFRQAQDDELIAATPTVRLKLETAKGKRERFATPDEADALIAALPASESALWATAFFYALRCGELRALRWSDIDDKAGRLTVARTWDEGDKGMPGEEVETKTDAGRREVMLRQAGPFLAEHWRLNPGAGPDDLVFGRAAHQPFVKSTVNARAYRAWDAAGMQRITLHSCRHSGISWWAAGGVELLALSKMAGHSSVAFTMKQYGHLMPDALDKAADRVDAFLAAARLKAD